MVSGALVLFAGSLLSWPHTAVRRRLSGEAPASRRPRYPRPRGAAVVLITAAFGAVAAGLGGVCSAVVLSVLGLWYVRSRRAHRDRLAQAAAFARGLRLLVAELRAGAHPAAASAGIAADAPSEVSDVFRRLAGAAHLGGDLAAGMGIRVAEGGTEARPAGRTADRHRTVPVRRTDRDTSAAHARPTPVPAEMPEGLRASLGRVGRAWELADRHGIALAEVLDAVCRDIEHRVAFARDIEVRMAGPRATAGVLALLPVLGLALGEATGSAPLAVLAGQPLGQLLLSMGTALISLGVVWTLRLTRAGVRI